MKKIVITPKALETLARSLEFTDEKIQKAFRSHIIYYMALGIENDDEYEELYQHYRRIYKTIYDI